MCTFWWLLELHLHELTLGKHTTINVVSQNVCSIFHSSGAQMWQCILWLMLRRLCVSMCVCLEASVACSCADEVSASRRLKRHTFTLSHSGPLLKSELNLYNKCVHVCVCIRLNASDPCHQGTSDFLITIAFQHQSRHCGWRRLEQSIYWPLPGTRNQQNPNSTTEQSLYTHINRHRHKHLPMISFIETDRLFW